MESPTEEPKRLWCNKCGWFGDSSQLAKSDMCYGWPEISMVVCPKCRTYMPIEW